MNWFCGVKGHHHENEDGAYACRLERQSNRATHDAERIAMNAWQVLGALWGISKDPEQCRIMNWFFEVAHGRKPEKPLFPLRLSEQEWPDAIAASSLQVGKES